MAAGRFARSRRVTGDYWPGFVDALTALLLVIMFLLSVFMLAQFFLSEAISGRDEALGRLNLQIAELSDLLSLERETSEDLASRLDALSTSLNETTRERDRLVGLLEDAEGEQDRLAALLTDRAATLERLEGETQDLTAERNRLLALLDDSESRSQAAEADLARLNARLAAADAERTAALDEQAVLRAALARLRDQQSLSAAEREEMIERLEQARLRAELAEAEKQKLTGELSEQEREALLEAEARLRLERLLDQQQSSMAALSADLREAVADAVPAAARTALEAELSAEEEALAEERAAVILLNQQIAALRQQLAAVTSALDAAETRETEQRTVIADLGRRLNAALAAKVNELQRYRSEFFGRLRQVLGNRDDIEIVGDRFVFRSEVLFESGSAEIGYDGQTALIRLATVLKDVMRSIPPDVDWILRVDGHTDRIPIRNAEFASNWELSAGRALSVVDFLIEEGIPPQRLAATGFGEYQPIDPGFTPDAYTRNRRIEFKLTER